MGFLGCLLMFTLFMTLSHDYNSSLAFFRFKSGWSCPKVNLKCTFKSPSTCTWHRDCRSPQKCCPLNCGKHCLSSSDDPCTEKLETKPCSSPLNQWYFSTTKNRCVPLNNGICPEGRNSFKTFDLCKKTCLAFGHGEPVKH
ncbi:eppin-like isoform X2 [Antechinus flavipes]|uniref:eppin-like isoform X2 n=1 Tax=Antechinus flavipes TaxID=38775 RepID=UPI002236584F|nr:eppin-like isoform X2 [Antechinus flavipes]